jgi:hypothetical protein
MAQRRSGEIKINDLQLQSDEPSLLFAIRELIRTGGTDFEKWFDEFKVGFYPRSTIATNFKSDEWKKPKFIDITPKGSESGCRTIEYWRDRDVQERSILLSGTDADLIRHIIQLDYEGGGSAGDESVSGKNSKPPLAGFPALRLTFVQPSEKLEKGQDYPVIGTKLIRCIGYTDDERIAGMGLAERITPSDVKRWATAIQKTFYKYTWAKGQGCLSYSGLSARLQGLEGYAYCKNKTDGIKLFTSLLSVLGRKPDPLCFFWSESDKPKEKYKQENSAVVLGKKIKPKARRPIADVVFDNAVLILPSGGIIPLVKRGVVVFK